MHTPGGPDGITGRDNAGRPQDVQDDMDFTMLKIEHGGSQRLRATDGTFTSRNIGMPPLAVRSTIESSVAMSKVRWYSIDSKDPYVPLRCLDSPYSFLSTAKSIVS